MPERPHIFDLDPALLRELVQSWGLASFRAQQVLDWVYRRHVASPAAMSNLSVRDRDLLAQRLRFDTGTVVQHQIATDGVQKLLMDWSQDAAGRETIAVPHASTPESQPCDPRPTLLPVLGSTGTTAQAGPSQIECVMIPAEDAQTARRTACISSQVGCPVGCRFCASGIGGLDGNLTAGQIVEQVWQLARLPEVNRISHMVFMGMGEPLANFEQVVRAIRTLMADWGMGISGRRITVSTVGVPAPIRRLADLELPVTLALSLHAPNDALRRRLIPWAQSVTIDQLVEACDYYFRRTGREITLEYILLREVNDRPAHARELSGVARRLRANVNLIRYNEVKGLPFARPATQDVRQFQAILRQAGVNTHIRASRGRDIAAACGQLRHEHARTP